MPGRVAAMQGRLIRGVPGLAVLVLTSLVGLAAANVSGAATARRQTCPTYHLATHSGGDTVTWHFYRLRAQRASCLEMRRVLHERVLGPTRHVTSCPSGGLRVGSWKVVLCGGMLSGERRQEAFRGRFTINISGPVPNCEMKPCMGASGTWRPTA